MKKKSGFWDIVASLRTSAKEELAYTEEGARTERGRESDRLRQQAHLLVTRGRDEHTHAIFKQAAALHPEDDHDVMASAARHDLGLSFCSRREGVRVENLLSGEQLYRSALCGAARNRYPLHQALTRDHLASCLRHLAKEPTQQQRAPALLAEAEQQLRQAIALALATTPYGCLPAACYLGTLGNLYEQQDRLKEAVRAFDRMERLLEKAVRIHALLQEIIRSPRWQILSPEDRHGIGLFLYHIEHERNDEDSPFSHLLINAAEARLAFGDRKHAIRLLRKVAAQGAPQYQNTALLSLARALCDEGLLKEARREAQQIRQGDLEPRHRPALAELYGRVGLTEEAILLWHRLIEEAHEERHHALADHAADESSAQAQRYGAEVAQLYTKMGEPVRAFLALENTAGSRFQEEYLHQTGLPYQSPVANQLAHLNGGLVHAAVLLDQMASFALHIASTGRPEMLRYLNEASAHAAAPQEPPEEASDSDRCWFADIQARLREALRSACAAPDPVSDLRRSARRIERLITRIGAACDHVEPGHFRPEDHRDLTPESLAQLLRRHPDHVFVRFSLRSDLMVVSVWLEEGALRGQALQLPAPERWLRLYHHLQRDPKQVDHAALTAEAEALDLSPALPPRCTRAVLLASSRASLLPLHALGPPGRTPLDRFKSLLWLPTLTPLQRRQRPQPPRAGSLMVVPGTAVSSPTRLHKQALCHSLPGEHRLEGEQAQLGMILKDRRQPDVVAFYTHGTYDGPEGPALELAGEPLRLSDVGGSWFGMERVELWACQSGVNLATLPLSVQGVDEDFGLDAHFVRCGVRSAIGALWTVPELPTAIIVHLYRQGLSAGADAAAALAAAQRHFRDEALPRLLLELRSGPLSQAFARFWAWLQVPLADADLGASLGPVNLAADQELDRWAVMLACPTSWAAFRFVGIPEHRPEGTWTPAVSRPPTADEQAEVTRLLAEAEAPDDGGEEDLAGWQEGFLPWAIEQVREEPPTAEQAVRIARIFRDRIGSSQTINLLCGLGWLHEVLADPALPATDRALVAVEAAHLWLDLAEGEVLAPALHRLYPPHTVALGRAARLLDGLSGNNPDMAAARARLGLLQGVSDPRSSDDESLQRATTAGLSRLEAFLDAQPPPDYGGFRFLTTLCTVLAADRRDPAQIDLALAAVRRAWPAQIRQAEQVNLLRLAAAALVLSQGDGREPIPDLAFRAELRDLLPPAELVRVAFAGLSQLRRAGEPVVSDQGDLVSQALSRLETSQWGYPSDDRSPLWHQVGTPGRAYRTLLGQFLEANSAVTTAAHVLGCLQLAADLRPCALHRYIKSYLRATQGVGPEIDPFFRLVSLREHLVGALQDAALARDGDGPHALDPFRLSVDALEPEGMNAGGMPTWILGRHAAAVMAKTRTTGRTVAYTAVRGLAWLTSGIDKCWEQLCGSMEKAMTALPGGDKPTFAMMLDPGLRIKDAELSMAQLPAGQAVMGLSLLPQGDLLISCVWNHRKGRGSKIVRSPKGHRIRGLLAGLLVPDHADVGAERGIAGARGVRWGQLEELLAEDLGEALGGALAAGDSLRLGVLAPGALRALPLLGLRAGRALLAEATAGVVHLPSLGFGWPGGPGGGDASLCLLAQGDPASDGMTGFGAAAVTTLRRLFPPTQVLEPRTPQARRIVEVDHMEALAQRMGELRIYGVGSIFAQSATAAHVVLSGPGRVLDTHNVQVAWPCCETVELWACTAGPGEADVSDVIHEDRDRIPGLARWFLLSGAAGVLDLAWPVHDLVKALVCERYGILRRVGARSGPAALAEALRWCRALFAEWREAKGGFRTPHEALAWLDRARVAALVVMAMDPRALVPFAPVAAMLPAHLTVEGLISEVTLPAHLGAFRFWGGMS